MGSAPDAPRLEVNRSQAREIARQALAEAGAGAEEEWRVLPGVRGGFTESHRFVWEEGGEEAFMDLLGTYLFEPSWNVRIARFTGPVEERAEEFHVGVGPGGSVFRIRHELPENREGVSLEEGEARALAEDALRSRFGLEPGELAEISAEATHRPARRDWSFTWSDPGAHPLEPGDARMRMSLAGILGGISGGLYFLLFAAAAVAGLVRWARGTFPLRTALLAGAVLVPTMLLSMLNSLPSMMHGAVTTQDLATQVAILGSVSLLMGVILASALALALGFAHGWTPSRTRSRVHPLLSGGALGLLLGGLKQAILVFGPREVPLWPSYGAAGTFVPALDPVLGAPMDLVGGAVFVLLVLAGLDRLTDGWTRNRLLAIGGLVVVGIAAPGPVPGTGLRPWLALGLATGVGLFLLYRVSRWIHPAFVPAMAAVVLAMDALREASLAAHPGAPPAHLLAGAVLLLLAWAWSRFLFRPGGGPSPAGAAA